VAGKENSTSNPLYGELVEMRVWSEPLPPEDIAARRFLAIPVNDNSFPTLRLAWLPLRLGGPRSHRDWWMTTACLGQTVPLNIQSNPSYALPTELSSPKPTLFWDRLNGWDSGRVEMGHTSPPPISRFRISQTVDFQLPPTLPAVWSTQLRYVIDDWTYEYDRVFIPESQWPVSHGAAAVKTSRSIWIPRVLKLKGNVRTAVLLGSSSELGLDRVVGGTQGFTVDL